MRGRQVVAACLVTYYPGWPQARVLRGLGWNRGEGISAVVVAAGEYPALSLLNLLTTVPVAVTLTCRRVLLPSVQQQRRQQRRRGEERPTAPHNVPPWSPLRPPLGPPPAVKLARLGCSGAHGLWLPCVTTTAWTAALCC